MYVFIYIYIYSKNNLSILFLKEKYVLLLTLCKNSTLRLCKPLEKFVDSRSLQCPKGFGPRADLCQKQQRGPGRMRIGLEVPCTRCNLRRIWKHQQLWGVVTCTVIFPFSLWKLPIKCQSLYLWPVTKDLPLLATASVSHDFVSRRLLKDSTLPAILGWFFHPHLHWSCFLIWSIVHEPRFFVDIK